MSHDFNDLLAGLGRDIATLRRELPQTMQAFSGLARAASAPGRLDLRTKELLAIAIGIAARCEGCIGFHVKAALAAGASREEVLEAVGMAIYMGAGPSMIYAAETLRALDQLDAGREAA